MKIGIYPGSFNPFHIGHYNIANKAEKIFDHIIIAQGKNPDKKGIDFEEYAEYSLPFKFIRYESSLIQLIKDRKERFPKNDYFIIRGLRNGYDLHYEEILRKSIEDAFINLYIVNFVYLFCDREYEHISSSMINNLNSCDEDTTRYFFDLDSKILYHENKETY